MALVNGFLLLAGFLTPIAALVLGVGIAGIALSWLPPATRSLFDALVPALLAEVMCAAIALLGPGASSVDAHLFGRREIIIPPASAHTPIE